MGTKTQKQRKCCYHNLNAKQLNHKPSRYLQKCSISVKTPFSLTACNDSFTSDPINFSSLNSVSISGGNFSRDIDNLVNYVFLFFTRLFTKNTVPIIPLLFLIFILKYFGKCCC